MLVLPQASFAVQVRVTERFPAQLPGVVASADVRLGLGSHASVAVGVAKLGLAGHSIVVGPGSAEIAGAAVSVTFTVWLAVLLLPQASLAVHVRVTEYFPAQLPGVVASADVRLGAGSQASVAVGVVKLGLAGHSIVVGPGSAVIAGAAVSVTFTVWLAVLVLLQTSLAVQVRVTEYLPAQVPGAVTSANVSVGVPQLSVAVAAAKLGVAGH